jgi:hypothetical protein
MRINYELDELDLTTRQQIESQLRMARIPYLLEDDQLLIQKVDEQAVDKIISQLGTVHNHDAPSSSRASYVDNKPMLPLYRETRDNKSKQELSIKLPKSMNKKESKAEDGGLISLVGGIIGVIFGVLLVVAQYQDPNYEGSIYIFLPAIIFGAAGLFVGSGIENLIRRIQGK